MATDELTHGRSDPGAVESAGYISPKVDFLLLFALTVLLSIFGAPVLFP